MNKDPEIKQSQLYIYDKVGYIRIKEIHDILTSKNCYKPNLRNMDFFDLKIMGKNVDSELAYIEENGIVKISLGPMNRWPDYPSRIQNSDKGKIKHVRMKMEYIYLNNDFKQKHFRGYKSLICFNQLYQKFHLELSKGLEINKNNFFIDVNFKDSNNRVIYNYTFTNYKPLKNRIQNHIINFWHNIKKGKNNEKFVLLFFHRDTSENKYTIIINPKYFNEIKEHDEARYIELIVRYEVINSLKFFLIFIFATAVLILSFFGTSDYATIRIPLIFLLSVGGLYLGLLTKQYQIPLKRSVEFLLFLTLIIIISRYIILLKF